MELYRVGKVVFRNNNYLILECNKVGYLIYVPKPERFNLDEEKRIYLFTYESEYSKTIYGFDNFKERIMFEDLITVQGIGPKTALAFLNNGWWKCMSLIAEGEWEIISKFPYISMKMAKQIVLDFQNKYKKMISNSESKEIDENPDQEFEITSHLKANVQTELEDTSKVLGFKRKQIDFALANLQPNDNFELLIEEAIRLISNARELRN